MNRREFLKTSGAGLTLSNVKTTANETVGGRRPAVIASANGLRATAKAMRMIRRGHDTLDAVVAGVNIVEADPADTSVGYGGLPNENGVIQLDSSVMHGPTNGAGAVAAISNIKHPSKVAQQVMESTDHVLLVGEGALKFAVMMGFKQQNLLTDETREIWLRWKRELSQRDDWIDPQDRLPDSANPGDKQQISRLLEHHGTINCNAVNEKGEISGVTTTSGLAFKIPGRVGDSPILGAGLYVDNSVGACGSTGRGEANLKTCASFMVVEFMRQGVSPEQAGLKVLQRIVENTTEPYLRDDRGRPKFNVNFYAINKQGEFAGTAIWSGSQYVAHDGRKNRTYDSAYLFKRE